MELEDIISCGDKPGTERLNIRLHADARNVNLNIERSSQVDVEELWVCE